VTEGIDNGNAVLVWRDQGEEAGFQFETIGENRRMPLEMDGVRLVEFLPEQALPQAADGL
jgi:CRISPR-associated protein Cas2